MHFDREFQIVLRRFRVVFGGLWFLAPHSPSQHPKKVDQRTAAANRTCIMRAVADGFTISTEHGVEEGNCAQASFSTGSCVHIRTSYRKMLTRRVRFPQFFRSPRPFPF